MISLKSLPIQRKIQIKIIQQVKELKFVPTLAVLRIGDDSASVFYATKIQKKGKKIGIKTKIFTFSRDSKEAEVISFIGVLNRDKSIHGIILQRPLPSYFDEFIVSSEISYKKDVEGLHPQNLGKLVLNKRTIFPCTAESVMEILDYYKIETESKKVAIIGASNIVGKPIANLLIQENSPKGRATVTICNKYTPNLQEITRKADIIFIAIGKANFLKGKMIKKGAILFDIGINVKSPSLFVGDVDFEDCKKKAFAITPVPGGVGRLTTVILFKNLLKAISLQ